MNAKASYRIIILTGDLGGGTGNHIFSMVNYWNDSIWKPEIVTSAPRLSARVGRLVPIHYLFSKKWLNVYPINQLRYLFDVENYIQKNPPDIVHSYFFWPIMYGRILKKLGKIKTLVENREDQGFNWGKHEYSLLRLSRSMPDKVVCVSEAVKQIVVKNEGIEENRVIVIKNGVECMQEELKNKEEARIELGLNADDLVVGMVANFNRTVKGVSLFIDAIPSIVRGFPNVKFILFGRGKQEQELRDKAKKLEIERFVVFAGFRQDIHRFYQIMDISVLASLSEGLSITLLESMSHRLPVVVTNVGGNSEVVVEGKTGFLVPPKDIASLSDRILKLLIDPTLRRKMGEEGRQRIEKYFQIRDVASQYLDVYKDVMKH